ncbi:TPA: thioesterase, partial [Escherichia coli]|nr:thioesterase [Escherichia coli]
MTNLLETFEMQVEHEDEGVVVISMPVTDKVKQPFG